jgi:hypothetical protein
MAEPTNEATGRGPARGGYCLPAVLLVLLAAAVIAVALAWVAWQGIAGLPALAWPAPQPTPAPKIITGAEIVYRIQQLSRLETTSYAVQTVVTAERPGTVLGVGRQRLLMIVEGTVVAGIDLGRLRPQDVSVSPDGRQVRIRLPEAQILSSGLDESKTQVYDFQTGLFTRPDPGLIVEAQRAGAAQLLQTACRNGIMQRATDDGRQALRQVIGLLGFETVEVETPPAPACPAGRSRATG